MTTPEDRKQTMKERARAYRKEAYQKAKARHKERLAAKGPDPRAEERKAKAREARKEAYQRAKERHKQKDGEAKAREKEAERVEAEALTAEREAELQAMITTAAKLAERPKLRLVKSDEAPSS